MLQSKKYCNYTSQYSKFTSTALKFCEHCLSMCIKDLPSLHSPFCNFNSIRNDDDSASLLQILRVFNTNKRLDEHVYNMKIKNIKFER